ncbi:hypothetical protein Tco_0893301 [Tanacetum coccineum]|uniref:Reverse transcriptase domain-containing protein n=1 Tax=Tanacetum coccineum TaxID=301880 RepID=A0ABQ5CEQ5_9ASTR
MQEVVKKEIVKLLDIGIIYPIADSPWVSPISDVQKSDSWKNATSWSKKEIVLGHKVVYAAGLEVDPCVRDRDR